jgi:hypothetical protein
MLRYWSDIVFANISQQLLSAAVSLIGAERNGEAFDPQLVVGIRESYGR